MKVIAKIIDSLSILRIDEESNCHYMRDISVLYPNIRKSIATGIG